jgi:hypothetical protein
VNHIQGEGDKSKEFKKKRCLENTCMGLMNETEKTQIYDLK